VTRNRFAAGPHNIFEINPGLIGPNDILCLNRGLVGPADIAMINSNARSPAEFAHLLGIGACSLSVEKLLREGRIGSFGLSGTNRFGNRR
jgi:hypothetical protein